MFRLKKDMAGVPAPAWGEADVNDPYSKAIDILRPMKVIVIGAGMSGLLCSIFYPRFLENVELIVYEKNADLGGTWYENRYPGIACDIPSHTYQFTFEENTQWSSFYASGPEIQAYLKRVSKKYQAEQFMKFNHDIQKAEWSDKTGKWSVTVKDTVNGKTFVDTSDIVISAVGILNKWNWPEIPGLHDFGGVLTHSADYDESIDLRGKRVALIGGGSTGIQILPKIQKEAATVNHYMKGRTWIPPAGFGGEGLAERGGDPMTPAADLERFGKDPVAYRQYRRQIEDMLNRPVEAVYKGTKGAEELTEMCTEHMRKKLAKKPEVFEALLPRFPPGCRRFTPGPGYLEALVEDNVKFISTGIKNVYESGIETVDGKRQEVDIIICATGFDGVYKQHFPVHGKYGANLQDLWDVIPEAYLSISPRLMPNYFVMLGPNGGPGLGSTVPFLELQAQYIMQAIQKIQREYIKSMIPTERAVRDFAKHVDRYFEKTIYSAPCNAWWRHKDGRLLAIWPGSLIHGLYIFRNPRWEDYEYELRDELNGDSMGWFGNGLSQRQIVMKDTTGYLDVIKVPVELPVTVVHTNNTNGANGV